ncbi:protein still life, isoform SIF type 1 isoform X5 [Octopus sinensis]|uniref:Protein still life, isoform SIF type 1 isoform X5 n=1 Tax=Octopus sinensis TaxID=2607531 RepID=A0A7E6EQJ8_9MOLL|nr:protein still life, isoform SIF type 1 isoform X5 [Octopus sinensis]
MGNKFCGPLLKKNYRHESYPWNIRKDSHLLRLWAEVFRVHGDGEYMRWERVSDDVVPVNISCIEDTPDTIFQITAYNRHVEKIFDVKIVQPGTIICPATDCFVHWRDPWYDCEWGLNFTSAPDARKFRDCCSSLSDTVRQLVKAFSQNSGLAHSVRVHSWNQRHTISGHEFSMSSSSISTRVTNATTSTITSTNNAAITLAANKSTTAVATTTTTTTTIAATTTTADLKPSTDAKLRKITEDKASRHSICIDTILFPTQRFARKASSANSLRLSPPKTHNNFGNISLPYIGGAAEEQLSNCQFCFRSIPNLQRPQAKFSSVSSPNSPVAQSRRVISSPLTLASDVNAQGYASDSDVVDSHDSQCCPPSSSDVGVLNEAATMPRMKHREVHDSRSLHRPALSKPASDVSVYDNVSSSPARRSLAETDSASHTMRRSDSPASMSKLTESTANEESKERPNLVTLSESPKKGSSHSEPETPETCTTFGRDLACSPKDNKMVETVKMETAFVGDIFKNQSPSSNSRGGAGYSAPAASSSSSAVRASAPASGGKGHGRTHPSTSESPESEWPSPPEPLTPQTPNVPFDNIDFDSDSLRRMLRSLPVSPIEKEDNDQGFHEDPYIDNRGQTHHRRYPSVSRTKSLNSYDRGGSSKPSVPHQPYSVGYPCRDDSFVSMLKNTDLPKSKQAKMLVEYELHLRNKCARDSYPDSGIGGVASETTGSLWSGDSSKSAGANKGAGAHIRTSAGIGSSGCGTVGKQSDYIVQFGDALDVKPYLSIEPSDDEPGDSDSSIHTMTSESQLSYGKQSGAIRKAGWLVVKNWLIHKKRKLELAPKRNWKRYWVCLKGTMLLFFDCDEESAITEESAPRHVLGVRYFSVIEGGIAQAVPEHPKRENIFSLSTAFGDAYLFQAPSQIELENWIRAIHSACASLFARQHGKDNTLKLLKSEIQRLETNIDMDVKMKKMAELQLTVVTDPKSRTAIVKQINQWEENLEKLFIEQYRLRCYMASLQGSELPNPKSLLANVSKSTKGILGRLGIFTVTSFHALVCARSPPTMTAMQGKTLPAKKSTPYVPKSNEPQGGTLGRHPHQMANQMPLAPPSHVEKHLHKDFEKEQREGRQTPDQLPSHRSDTPDSSAKEGLSKISLPHNQVTDRTNWKKKWYNFHPKRLMSHSHAPGTILVGVDEKSTVQDLLEFVCSKRGLSTADHFVRLQVSQGNYSIPHRCELIKKLKYEAIEVCQKSLFHIELTKSVADPEFGFRVEAELSDHYDKDDELQVYVCEIKPGGLAHRKGLIPGDEILIINGKIVSELDMVFIEALLHESHSLCMTVQTCRVQVPTVVNAGGPSADTNDSIIQNTIGTPPQPRDKALADLSVGSPGRDSRQGTLSPRKSPLPPKLSPKEIDVLLKNTEQVTAMCRLPNEPYQFGETPSRPLSEAQKLRKVIMELLETERAYVKDLNVLIERYLNPLKAETLLTSDEIMQLFGNIQEIVQFQEQFLQSLEEAIELGGDFFTLDDPKKFRDEELRRVLFSLGGSFLYYANHFKVYSSFCASHSRSQKILNPDANAALKEFLLSRNPKQQHSCTLESFLIKPIQRILKYPLLLQQLCQLTDPETDEHYHLSEALRGMEAVAEHINEMQKIYEEYGYSFDELSRMYKEHHPHNKPVDLSVGELQMYGTVQWCNAIDFLGKIKKGTDLENVVFVFKTGIVFLCRERVKRKLKKSSNSRNAPMSEGYDAIPRFRTLIPVHEVQVVSGSRADCERHYWWQLIHSKSEVEGRPERLYQFCNCTSEAKTDFMKVIRQTIRDSVRKMAVPSARQTAKTKYIPFGGKRLECLGANPRTLSKMRGGLKAPEVERHSVDFEENFNNCEYDSMFRTRSKTIGNLNEVAQGEDKNEKIADQVPARPASSIANPYSTAPHGMSSRHLRAAAREQSGSRPTSPRPTSGSPVWKPRQDPSGFGISGTSKPGTPTQVLPSHAVASALSSSEASTPTTSSAYGDYSDVVYRADTPSRVITHQPSHCIAYKDTEC